MTMDTTEITVTLPSDLLEEVEKRVTSGAFANASEVALAGLHLLFDEQKKEQH